MPIVKKGEFIEQFIRILDKALREGLPTEDFEFEMIRKAWEIIVDKARHINQA